MGHSASIDYRVIPRCIFTSPEIAAVGYTEKEAAEIGYQVKVGTFPFRASGKAQATSHWEGLVKLVADENSDALLGAHIIGAHATDIIGELALALKLGATIQDLGQTIHAHPTMAEAVMEAAHVQHGRAIHI
jgi:dihydrolipoamide dehydrogenase